MVSKPTPLFNCAAALDIRSIIASEESIVERRANTGKHALGVCWIRAFVWIVNGLNYGHAEATIQIHEYLALKFDYECAEATKNFWRKATHSLSLSAPLSLPPSPWTCKTSREFLNCVYDNLWPQSLHLLNVGWPQVKNDSIKEQPCQCGRCDTCHSEHTGVNKINEYRMSVNSFVNMLLWNILTAEQVEQKNRNGPVERLMTILYMVIMKGETLHFGCFTCDRARELVFVHVCAPTRCHHAGRLLQSTWQGAEGQKMVMEDVGCSSSDSVCSVVGPKTDGHWRCTSNTFKNNVR